MTKKELLAYEIAKHAHEGQKDESGIDYINHPLFVASNCKTEDERIVALLHDVIEDTSVVVEDLKKHFDDNIIDAVLSITKVEGVSYEQYLSNVKNNSLARAVKIQDIRHNMDIKRISTPTQKDFERVKKYEKALEYLLDNSL